jgi:thiamine biosynthesis lipoprotein
MARRSPIAVTMFFLTLFVIGFYIALQFGRNDDGLTRTQVALGTMVEVQIRGMERAEAWPLMDAVFAEVRRVDTLFSTYKEGGPVWKFNHADDSLLRLPAEVYALMLRCDSLTRATGGAFDIAVEPLITSWGFDGDNAAVPAPDVLQRALAASGWRHVTLRGEGSVVKKADARINFGAIAKGYAVDRAVAVLRDNGVKDGLVNAGGEVRTTGGDWSIGIQHPRSPSELVAVVDPKGRAVATSGDYEQYFEIDGLRYHHILNPQSGLPARGCQSVSVIADDDVTADALATAIFVMGVEKGMEFVKQYPDIEALIIDEQGREHVTPGFGHYRTR